MENFLIGRKGLSILHFRSGKEVTALSHDRVCSSPLKSEDSIGQKLLKKRKPHKKNPKKTTHRGKKETKTPNQTETKQTKKKPDQSKPKNLKPPLKKPYTCKIRRAG